MQHRGRAVVFEDIDDYKARIEDEALDIDETCVMVLKNCGPRGYPGMAEVGNMGLPPKVLRKGITDMVRISRRAHVGHRLWHRRAAHLPEAARGGPLAVVRTGDMIELDVAEPPPASRHLRRGTGRAPRRLESRGRARPSGGYAQLYHDHVQGADTGADLDFLVGCRGNAVARESALMARPRSPSSASARSRATSTCRRSPPTPTATLAATVSRQGKVEGVPNFTDFDDLPGRGPDMPAVALCMPPDVRLDMCRAAIAAGRDLLIEKPPAATLGEIETIIDGGAKAGVALFATWHSPHGPGGGAARATGSPRAGRTAHHITWREDVRSWHPGQDWIWEPGGMGVFDPGINALSILTEILPGPHPCDTRRAGGSRQTPAPPSPRVCR